MRKIYDRYLYLLIFAGYNFIAPVLIASERGFPPVFEINNNSAGVITISKPSGNR